MNKFSVIIPTYNEQQRIGEAVRRLLDISKAFSEDSFEVIVVDGGSTDATCDIVSTYSQLRLITTASGRGRQLSVGAKEATGNILIFLHADTIVQEDYFRQVAAAIDQGYGWGCAHIRFRSEEGKSEKGIFSLITFFSNLRINRSSIAYGDQSIFCSAEFYAQHGGYDPDLIFFEDYRFSQRARAMQRPAFIQAKSYTSSRRHRQQGVLRTLWRMQTTRWRYMSGMPIEQLWEYYNR